MPKAVNLVPTTPCSALPLTIYVTLGRIPKHSISKDMRIISAAEIHTHTHTHTQSVYSTEYLSGAKHCLKIFTFTNLFLTPIL